jgi:hypothetical protein
MLNDLRQPTTLREYDVNRYTFQFEKTFLDRQFSIEFRLPIQNTLSSRLDLVSAGVIGVRPVILTNNPALLASNSELFGSLAERQAFVRGLNRQFRIRGLPERPLPMAGDTVLSLVTESTTDRTLGRERTELGNLSLIFKWLIHQTPKLFVSGGVGVRVPTAPDTQIQVVDYGAPQDFNTLEWQRVRQFHVKNETWGLSPFLAALYTPNNRLFAQGFLQLDAPVNSSRVTYSETIPVLLNEGRFLPVPPNILEPPFTVTGEIEEQTLFHLDLGTGFWVIRNPCARWINGLIPTLELHYTSTLRNADIVVLPNDSAAVPGGIVMFPDSTGPEQIGSPESAPTVGNRRNRLDLLDLTLGATLVIAKRSTLALAFSVPLREEDNRTFDWEFHVQFNLFGAGLLTTPPSAPPF